MVAYESFTLKNKLKVIVHEDPNTSIAVMNILYDVGSRNESPEKTGFAHLFEHLMFGGSKNVKHYDRELQKAGGENNAFTSQDLTNYYLTLPSQNLETGFWLESDRMLSLSFDPEVLEVQRKVVIEEFKQRYLNQPYGDVWLNLYPLAYQVHPYRWPTIGEKIAHIEEATMDDVKDFFYTYYTPENAILVVAGNVKLENVRKLAEKWFEPIPNGKKVKSTWLQEPTQEEVRIKTVSAKVPQKAIYTTYKTIARNDANFYANDLVSDILGKGESSLLHHALVKEKGVFSTIGAYITGTLDPGLLSISGRINDKYSLDTAHKILNDELESIVTKNKITEKTLQKAKNQSQTQLAFSEVEVMNRAMNLAFYTLMGDTNYLNTESKKIESVTLEEVKTAIEQLINQKRSSTLLYDISSK